MKAYPRQSCCPHCKTIYRYGDIKKLMWKKSAQCYHCKKQMTVKKTGFLVLAAEILAIYALLNVIMLNVVRGISFIGLFAVNIIPAIAAILLLPYYVELKKKDKPKNKKK